MQKDSKPEDTSTITKEKLPLHKIESGKSFNIEIYNDFNPFDPSTANQGQQPKIQKRVSFICEHASPHLPESFSWTEHDKTHFKGTHWSYDLGCLDLSRSLNEHFQGCLLYAKYSRLFLDINRGPGADTLSRKDAAGEPVDLNKDLTFDEQMDRFRTYHTPYWRMLREIHNKIDSQMIVSIHTYTPCFLEETRELELGILSCYIDGLAVWIYERMKNCGYKIAINRPYNVKLMDTQSNLCVLLPGEVPGNEFETEPDSWITGPRLITFEIRNDLLQDPEHFKVISAAFANALEEYLTESGKKEAEGALRRYFQKELEETCRKRSRVETKTKNGGAVLYHPIKKTEENSGEESQPDLQARKWECRVGFISPQSGTDIPNEEELNEKDKTTIQQYMEKNGKACQITKKLAVELADKYHTMALYTSDSWIYCDVTKSISSKHVVPEYLNSTKLDFNSNLSLEQINKRMKESYLGFYNNYGIVNQLNRVYSRFLISLRLMPERLIYRSKVAKQGSRTSPQVVITTKVSDNFGYRFFFEFSKFAKETFGEDFEVLFNDGVLPLTHFDYSHHAFLSTLYPRGQEGVIINLRPELLTESYENLRDVLDRAVFELCYLQHGRFEIYEMHYNF